MKVDTLLNKNLKKKQKKHHIPQKITKILKNGEKFTGFEDFLPLSK